MIRCSNCLLPETNPNISFDSEGVCNFCHNHKKIDYLGEEKLKEILANYRGKGNPYDCVIGLSGGRDSSFTLLKMVKDYDMNVLAVNYENPFTDEQAKENIDNAIDILDVDIVRFKLSNQIHEKTFKNNFLTWFKKPDPALIPIVCVGCKVFYKYILQSARKYDVPCIITGGNPLENTVFKNELLNITDDKLENQFMKCISGVLSKSVTNLGYYHPQCIHPMMVGYLFGHPHAIGSRIYGKNISRIDLFSYIEWNEEEVLSRIRSEINWNHPKKLNSTWRFDCKIAHLKDLMYLYTLKMTERDDLYSQMIREGLISRDDGLNWLENENRIYLDEIEDIFDMVGIRDKSIITQMAENVESFFAT